MKFKKIMSIALASAISLSALTAVTLNTSALIEEDGSYTPAEGIETFRYYCAVPSAWFNEETEKVGNTAGLYWWNGIDACGAIDGSGGSLSWPGYKAKKADTEAEVPNLFYLDVPVGYTGNPDTDVPTVVWNNYLNGGTDKEAPIYTMACQAADAATEYLSEGDSETYDNLEGFWDMVYEGDYSVFGDYASNFEYEDLEGSFVMDNMVYVMDLAKTSENFEGKMTYVGDWYFYYGNGEYGNWPTKELYEANSEAAGTVYGNFTTEDYYSTAEEPTTEETTVEEPTTVEPSTAEPTTAEPTTVEPSTAEPTDAIPVYGDVNSDKVVNIADVTIIQRAGIGLETVDATVADVNFDGRVSVKDVTLVQKYLAGYKNTGSVGQPVA